ncbi:MAG: hypothetical protein RDV48_25855 [Candidatus Eremiobacteraeota bacterium]|nr:hypothetical protein [Candidatus Eremiobacteraeota bacterium]
MLCSGGSKPTATVSELNTTLEKSSRNGSNRKSMSYKVRVIKEGDKWKIDSLGN